MISIIVTVYNIENYISKCIDSIRSQTFSDIEIVLVDDGSTDKSGKICDFYKNIDRRIKVIHKENGGVVSARKSGITASSGKYIGFVDGDDWVEATMYEELYYSLTKHKVQVAMCGRYEDSVDFSKKVFHRVPEGKYNKSEMVRDVYPHMIVGKGFFEWGIFPGYWDKLFERELIERVLMEVDDRLVMGEDAACILPCLLCADSIYVVH